MKNLAKYLVIGTAFAGLLAPAGAAADAPAADVHQVKQSRDAVLDFWTKERMRNADGRAIPAGRAGAARAGRPAGEPRATPGTSEGIDTPKAGDTKNPRTGASSSYAGLELPWTNNSYGQAAPIAAVGRIYVGGTRGHCTGTVVSANIVVTAAHCVQNGLSGAWQTNVMFAPGVNGSSQPYGRFAARVLVTPNTWASPSYNRVPGTGGGYYGTDYAYLVLHPNRSGRHVGSYTAAYAILANAPNSSVYHLGYPTEGTWNGCNDSFCRPWHCQSPIQRYTQYQGGKYDVGMSCFTTGGASGGPWFQNHNGRWYVTSVMSHMGRVFMQSDGRSRYGTTFFGSYFDNSVLSLFNFAQRQ
jgi:V8-like Glu-specific endopeptidase